MLLLLARHHFDLRAFSRESEGRKSSAVHGNDAAASPISSALRLSLSTLVHDLTTQRTPPPHPLFQIYLLPAACHVKSLKKLREEFFRQDDDGALVIKVAEKREKRRLVTHDAIFRPYFFDVGLLR